MYTYYFPHLTISLIKSKLHCFIAKLDHSQPLITLKLQLLVLFAKLPDL